MSTLQDAIAQVQTYMLAIGVRGAPATPPEQPNVFPFAICQPASGLWHGNDATGKTGLHTIWLDVHVARRDLSHDVLALWPFIETVPNKLIKEARDSLWAGTISALLSSSAEPIRYQSMTFQWDQAGMVKTIGLRFSVTVKMQSAVS